MKKIDFLLAILMAVAWGSNYLVTKKALNFFSPIFFTSIKFLIIGLFLVPTLRRIPPKLPILILMSFSLVVLFYGSLAIGIKMNSSAVVPSIVTKFQIITSMVAAYIFLAEKLTKKQIFGIFLGFIGVFIVIIGNTFKDDVVQSTLNLIKSGNSEVYFDKNNIISLLFLFFSCLIWPVYSTFSKKISKNGINELEIMGWVGIFGGLFSLVVSFIFEKNQMNSLKQANIGNIGYILYTTFIGTLLPHLILHRLIKLYGVCKTSVFKLLVPLVAIIGGVLFFKEKINIFIISGALLLTLSVYIITNKSKNNESCFVKKECEQ